MRRSGVRVILPAPSLPFGAPKKKPQAEAWGVRSPLKLRLRNVSEVLQVAIIRWCVSAQAQ
jgi:hypothetical protein